MFWGLPGQVKTFNWSPTNWPIIFWNHCCILKGKKKTRDREIKTIGEPWRNASFEFPTSCNFKKAGMNSPYKWLNLVKGGLPGPRDTKAGFLAWPSSLSVAYANGSDKTIDSQLCEDNKYRVPFLVAPLISLLTCHSIEMITGCCQITQTRNPSINQALQESVLWNSPSLHSPTSWNLMKYLSRR